MTKAFRNRFLTAPLTFSLGLALIGAGCGAKNKSKNRHPTPGLSPLGPTLQRPIVDPVPLASLAPRWLDFNSVPPSFPALGASVVPIDIEAIHSQLTFDVAKRTASGQATLTFVTYDDGFPMLDLEGAVSAVVLDGTELTPGELVTTDLPDMQSTVRVLQKPLIKGEKHTLTLAYTVPVETLTFSDAGVSFGLFMSDLRGRPGSKYYLERYVPANFEYDQFRLRMDISVLNSTGSLQLFTNGTTKKKAPDAHRWDVTFPDYFTASSPYLHLTERAMAVKEDVYQGIERNFPITLYGPEAEHLEAALISARQTLQELEADYGAYPHESLVIYLNNAMRGGMEYSGATATSLWALPHEITHSWFARSVMPADGNSGWIDEAIASWRDDGYPSHQTNVLFHLPELAAGSLFQRYTNSAAYTSGAELLSSIDKVLERKSQTRLKTVLAKFYKDRQNKIVTSQYFQKFIESESQLDFGDYFAAYAFEKYPGATAGSLAGFQRTMTRSSPFHAPALNAEQLREIL